MHDTTAANSLVSILGLLVLIWIDVISFDFKRVFFGFLLIIVFMHKLMNRIKN